MTPSQASTRTALVTGGSRGLGRALVLQLVDAGWTVVTDGRRAAMLDALRTDASQPERLITVTGDVADPLHRAQLARAVDGLGVLDVLVNNASDLGPSPLPPLRMHPIEALRRIYDVNVIAPLALMQLFAARLEAASGCIVNVSSDAAVELYEHWAGYGSSKAALDHLSAIAALEHPEIRVYAFDPGDMATDMQQAAFPSEDVSDRPTPDSVVPVLLRLIEGSLRSGRYRAAELAGTSR